MIRIGLAISIILTLVLCLHAQVKVSSAHQRSGSATGAFKFKDIPSPSKDDVASRAKLSLLDGEIDPNGADLSALVDGALPTEEDQPQANFFFNAGTGGGRFRIDLGSAIDIAQVNTYSWHPDSRGPQVYRLWASEGTDSKFNAEPRGTIDPATVGWKLVTVVDTRSRDGDDGGQYAVSISDSRGSLGRFRFLLFDCYVTETADNWGNTFYSEVDVIAKK